MNEDDRITPQQLGAFVDGELDASERALVFDALSEDSEAAAALAEYRTLKDLMKHAYSDVPKPFRCATPRVLPRLSGMRRAAGIAAVTMFSALAGALLGYAYAPPSIAGGGAVSAADAPVVQVGVLLHLTSNDPERVRRALDLAEEIVAGTPAGTDPMIEIVANERGLDLMRMDLSQHRARIRDLAAGRVLFTACARGIKNLRDDQVDVQLIPEARRDVAAIDVVAERLQSGWRYEKI